MLEEDGLLQINSAVKQSAATGEGFEERPNGSFTDSSTESRLIAQQFRTNDPIELLRGFGATFTNSSTESCRIALILRQKLPDF